MKALIFGGTGQVGFELLQSLWPFAEYHAPGVDGEQRLDLGDLKSIERRISDYAPDVVINAAAYTAVDKAEVERVLAERINTDAPGAMARSAAKSGAAIIHFSTDYVFDGSGDAPFTEDQIASPLNHYGASKLAGERLVAIENPRHLIFRTSWVYSTHGKNFPKTILRLAKSNETLSIVNDQVGAPTGAALLAVCVAQALLNRIEGKGSWGHYHLVADGETSWHGLAEFVCERAVAEGIISRCPAIKPVTSGEFGAPAMRPLNSRLSTQKFQADFAMKLPHWRTGVTHFVRELARAQL